MPSYRPPPGRPRGLALGARATVVVALPFTLMTVGAMCKPAVDPSVAADVSVVLKTEPPPECRFISRILGRDTDRSTPFAMTYGSAEADLRRTAARAGGNYVVVDATIPPRPDIDIAPEFRIEGRLFSCPRGGGPAPSPTPAAAPPPSKPCEPECSPGFTCLRGSCVSACNPACDTTQRCGSDRLCHAIEPGK